MPASSIEELLSFESPMELSFCAMANQIGIDCCYESRSINSASTPWVTVRLDEGEPTGHMHIHANGQIEVRNGVGTYDDWVSRLTWTVTTNRGDDDGNPEGLQHKRILGKIRTICRVAHLRNVWLTLPAGEFYRIADLRPAGCQGDIENEENLDISTISFNIRHSINPAAWPY